MPRHWFLKTKSGKAGPITSKALIQLVVDGKVKPASGISADGDEWIKASQITGLPFPKAEPKKYWVKTRGGDAGPFTLPKLAKLAAAGRVKPNVMVSSNGRRWKQAQEVSGLSFPQPPEAQANAPEPVAITTSVAIIEKPELLKTPPSRTAASFVREAEFVRCFGQRGSIASHDESSIQVHVHPANINRPVATIVTSGLSDHAMPVSAASSSPRAELILYANEASDSLIGLLGHIADQAVRRNLLLTYGSTFENGQPLFKNSELDGCIFLVPNVTSDFDIRNAVTIDGAPLHMLWVVPTTSLERSLITRNGISWFCKQLDHAGHGLMVDPVRPCLAKQLKRQSC